MDLRASIKVRNTGQWQAVYVVIPNFAFPMSANIVDEAGNGRVDPVVLKDQIKKHLSDIVDRSEVERRLDDARP